MYIDVTLFKVGLKKRMCERYFNITLYEPNIGFEAKTLWLHKHCFRKTLLKALLCFIKRKTGKSFLESVVSDILNFWAASL